MKKIITFLVSVTMVASAFAQYSGNGQRDNGPKDNGYSNNQKDNGYGNNGYGNNGYGNNGYGNNGYGNNGYGSYDKGKDVICNDGRGRDDFFRASREKDMQIAQINWEYDHKIQSVKNRFFMPRFRKEQIICQLEEQRQDEIKMVIMRFNMHKNRYDDFDHDHGRRNW